MNHALFSGFFTSYQFRNCRCRACSRCGQLHRHNVDHSLPKTLWAGTTVTVRDRSSNASQRSSRSPSASATKGNVAPSWLARVDVRRCPRNQTDVDPSSHSVSPDAKSSPDDDPVSKAGFAPLKLLTVVFSTGGVIDAIPD